MDKARIYIDFNEVVDKGVYLLSKDDIKLDSLGNPVIFFEGMRISIYSDDADDEGRRDNLIAEATAIKVNLSEYNPPSWREVKWCCRVDMDSLMHESDLK